MSVLKSCNNKKEAFSFDLGGDWGKEDPRLRDTTAPQLQNDSFIHFPRVTLCLFFSLRISLYLNTLYNSTPNRTVTLREQYTTVWPGDQ